MHRRTTFCALALLALTGTAHAHAQTPYPAEANMRFEIWNGSAWASTINANPGDRIEWRAVISYTGTRTNIQGLAEALYQPTISNADNQGPVMDELGTWRNGGVGAQSIPAGMLSIAEGNDGGQLPSYGRIGFGAIGTSAFTLNTLSSFRHVDGSNGAPPGSWLRLAGSYVSQWPVAGSGPGWTTDDGNRILRGVPAAQGSRLSAGGTGGPNPYWRGGTLDLVLIRQSLTLGDLAINRAIEITTEERFIRRVNLSSGTDNRRYVSWYTQDAQLFSSAYRTSLTITPAIALDTIPAPGAAVVVLACLCIRRRR